VFLDKFGKDMIDSYDAFSKLPASHKLDLWV